MNTKVIIVLATILCCLCCSVISPTGKGYKEIWYKDVSPVETDNYNIRFFDMHSQEDFCLVRAEIVNKTQDFLTLERSETTFTIDGNSQNLAPKKWLIKPLATKKVALKTAPMPGLPAEQVSVVFRGLSTIPVKGALPDLESYQLPDTKKIISTDNLTVKLTRMSKKTKITECTFEVKNIGKEPVLFDHTRVTCTAEGNDNNWPTKGATKGYRVLWPTKDVGFHLSFSIPGQIVDMQFANMLIHWNEAFIVSSLVDEESTEFLLEMDLGKTEGKN